MLDRVQLHLPGDHLPRPHGNCYWLVPGQIMAGEYPRTSTGAESKAKLGAILAAGMRQFIDLTEFDEPLEKYDALLASEARRLGVAVYHARHPIKDLSIPTASQMSAIIEAMGRALSAGLPTYLHCWGGIGRTGTVVGCLLVESGLTGDEALALIARKWRVMAKRHERPRSPETDAQAEFVRDWTVLRGQSARPDPMGAGAAAERRR